MKVKTKKIVQVGLHSIVLAAALQASAGTIGAADPVTVATTISNGGCTFVSANSSFAFTQSRNVGLGYQCDPTTVVVQAGNTKGKFIYGGTSNGGSVKQCGTTAASTANGYVNASPTLTADGCS